MRQKPSSQTPKNLRQIIRALPGHVFVVAPRYEKSLTSRLLSWGIFSLGAVVIGILTKRKPDIVIGSSMNPIAALAGFIIAKRHRAKFIYEVRDLWPETPIQMGALSRKSSRARTLLALEGLLAKSAVCVISPLPLATEYFTERHGLSPDKVHYVPNGVEIGDCYPAGDGHITNREALNLQYFGSLGYANQVDLIIRAMASCRNQFGVNVTCEFFGEGPQLPALQDLACVLNVEDFVTFHRGIPSQAVPEAMARGDAVVIVIPDIPGLYRYGVSMNKIFDYLAGDKPILAVYADAVGPLDDAPGVLRALPTEQSLAESMHLLSQMTSVELRALGAGNREFVSGRFRYESIAERLATILAALE